MLNANDTGQKSYEDYVTEHINGTQSDESRQKDSHVRQQDNHHQAKRQDGRSKGDDGSLWETNDPRKIDQRH